MDSYNNSTTSDGSLYNGAHSFAQDGTTKGNDRCLLPDRNRRSHGSPRAEERRAQCNFSPELLADLARSGLDAVDAEAVQFEDLTPDETFELTRQRRQSYRQLYFDINGRPTGFYRIRFLDEGDSNDFKAAKSQRYWQPSGTAPHLYFAPFIDWQSVLLTNGPLLFVEGAKKSIKACRAGKHCIGLDGVWSFKSKSTGQFWVLDEIRSLNLKNRDVCIIFDSDVVSKPQILGAMHEFARQLANLGARPSTIILPGNGDQKVGLDDLLVAHGDEALEALPREQFSEIEALWKMNTRYAVIQEPAAILKLDSERLIDVHKFKDLLVANQEIIRVSAKGEPKIVAAGPEWLRWKARRQHSKMVYEPGQPEVLENGDYNKWRRGCEPRPGDVDAFIALIDHLFAGKPPREREWFLRWCAYPVQHPGTKLYSAVVFFGSTQGSGKSLLGEMLCGVYGKKNSVEIDRNTLSSTFNAWSVEKQFVLANEIADRKDLRLDADTLKNMISREWVLVNEKYQPHYSVRDSANYVFTSNHYAGIYMDDQDRRYAPLHVEGKLPVEISSVLRSWKDRPKGKYTNGEGFGPLHQHLLGIELGDFDPTAAALHTLDRETTIRAGGSDLDSWCQDLKADPMPFLRSGSENFKERDLWRVEELVSVYKIQRDRRVSEKALVNALRAAGFLELGRTRTHLGRLNLWAIGNPDRWREASESERAEEYTKGLRVTKLDQLVQS